MTRTFKSSYADDFAKLRREFATRQTIVTLANLIMRVKVQVRQKPRLAWAPFLCNLNIVFLLLFKAHDRITTALVMLEKFECFDELFQRKNAINAGLHRTG